MDFSAGLSFNAFSLAAQGLAAVFSASSAKAVTKYNNAVAQAQADIARINAKTMEDQYAQRLFAAESQYQHETMRAGRVKQQQKVALAANGLAIGVGSAAELQASTDIIKKIDLQRIESNAKAEATDPRRQITKIKHSWPKQKSRMPQVFLQIRCWAESVKSVLAGQQENLLQALQLRPAKQRQNSRKQNNHYKWTLSLVLNLPC